MLNVLAVVCMHMNVLYRVTHLWGEIMIAWQTRTISVGLLKTGIGDCIFFCTTCAHMQYAIPEANFVDVYVERILINTQRQRQVLSPCCVRPRTLFSSMTLRQFFDFMMAALILGNQMWLWTRKLEFERWNRWSTLTLLRRAFDILGSMPGADGDG